MGGSAFANAGVFLINTLFGFAIIIVLARVFLQLVRANFFNPICQFVVKVTNPVLAPVKTIIPNIGRLDTAALLLAWVLQLLETFLRLAVVGVTAPVATLLLLSVVQLFDMVLMFFTIAIFLQVILSWVSPNPGNPLAPVLYQLTGPIVDPIRRTIPPLGGLDFSPMIALIGLQLIRILTVQPLLGA